MHVESHSPAIRTRRKARHSEGDEARAIRRAVGLWGLNPNAIPVVWGGRCLGWLKGDPAGGRSIWMPSMSLAQGTYTPDIDTIISRKTADKHWGWYAFKPIDTGIVIDNWYDAWGSDGTPQKGDWSGTARTARKFLNTTTGAMNIGPAVSPSVRYLTRASGFGSESTVFSWLLYDRVLAYDACTMTGGSQSMTNTITATRYITNGDPGLQVFIECDTVHSNTAANLTVLTYVNNSGTGSRVVATSPTLTKISAIAAPTATLGARGVIQCPGASTKSWGGIYLTLQSGDQGIQQLTNYTWSAAPTGTNSFVLQFPLALFPDLVTQGCPSDYTFTDGLESINKRIFDDACLSLMYNSHVTAQPSLLNTWVEVGWT